MTKTYERLKRAREDAGFDTATDFARAFNLNESTYRSHENGTRGLRMDAASRYANLLKINLTWLLTGKSEANRRESLKVNNQPMHTIMPIGQENGAKPKRFVPIIGELRSGMFKEEADAQEPIGYVQDMADDRFSGLPRYAKRVIGPSMNNVIPDGSVALFVSLMDLGRDPENGEIVEVIRRDKNGMVESTIKRYVETEDARYLMPDSSHPEHREPIKLDDNGEEDAVTVRGLMIRAIIDF